jgi:hypothetical protein
VSTLSVYGVTIRTRSASLLCNIHAIAVIHEALQGVKHIDCPECRWNVEKVINIPKSAAFQDYSDLAFAPGKRGSGIKNQLAITSQVC